MKETNIGKYVIVRGDRSGVFAGILADRDGQEASILSQLWCKNGRCGKMNGCGAWRKDGKENDKT